MISKVAILEVTTLKVASSKVIILRKCVLTINMFLYYLFWTLSTFYIRCCWPLT